MRLRRTRVEYQIALQSLMALLAILVGNSRADENEPANLKRTGSILTVGELADVIDQQIEKSWQPQSVVPANRCTDSQFVRRAYLDLLGRIPKVSEAREFLSTPDSGDKRDVLIQKLLSRPAADAHLALQMRHIWMPQSAQNPELYHLGIAFEEWLLPRIQRRTAYDEIVRELLTVPLIDRTADGLVTSESLDHSGAIAFYQVNDLKPENLASSTSRVLLGVRLECAQCHNHPFDSWTQDQFWQTAAFFTSVNSRTASASMAAMAPAVDKAMLSIPEAGRTVSAAFLEGASPEWKPGVIEPREALAEWVTAEDNAWFSKNICNRIWAQFMGRGFVNPVDDFRPDNPPTHPELLDTLADQLAKHDYDLRYLQQAIMSSRTYQRSSEVTESVQFDASIYARMIERPLSAEQLWASLVTATGSNESIPHAHRGLVDLSATTEQGEFMITFPGAPQADLPQLSLTHSLKLMQGSFVSRMCEPNIGPALTAVASSPFLLSDEKIETLYLATLSRMPSAEELDLAVSHVGIQQESAEQARRLGHVFWALLNSSEFLLNH